MEEEKTATVKSESARNLVTFRLDKEIYGLPIDSISKIISMVTITPIPKVHHAIEGIINVRGDIVPVINLRRYLGVPEVPLGLHTPIVLVQMPERTMGLIVDEVMDVLEVEAEQVTHLEQIIPEELGEVPILQGVVHSREGAILLLDIERLFLPSQAKALARVVETLDVPDPVLEEDGEVADNAGDSDSDVLVEAVPEGPDEDEDSDQELGDEQD